MYVVSNKACTFPNCLTNDGNISASHPELKASNRNYIAISAV